MKFGILQIGLKYDEILLTKTWHIMTEDQISFRYRFIETNTGLRTSVIRFPYIQPLSTFTDEPEFQATPIYGISPLLSNPIRESIIFAKKLQRNSLNSIMISFVTCRKMEFKFSCFLFPLFDLSVVSVFIYKCRILRRFKTFQSQIKSVVCKDNGCLPKYLTERNSENLRLPVESLSNARLKWRAHVYWLYNPWHQKQYGLELFLHF